MSIADQVSEAFVKPVTANFVVTPVCYLHHAAAENAANGEVEGPATPIEYQDNSVFKK